MLDPRQPACMSAVAVLQARMQVLHVEPLERASEPLKPLATCDTRAHMWSLSFQHAPHSLCFVSVVVARCSLSPFCESSRRCAGVSVPAKGGMRGVLLCSQNVVAISETPMGKRLPELRLTNIPWSYEKYNSLLFLSATSGDMPEAEAQVRGSAARPVMCPLCSWPICYCKYQRYNNAARHARSIFIVLSRSVTT